MFVNRQLYEAFEPTTQLKVSVSPLHLRGDGVWGFMLRNTKWNFVSLVTIHLLSSKVALGAEKNEQQCRPPSRPITLELNDFVVVHISTEWEKMMT